MAIIKRKSLSNRMKEFAESRSFNMTETSDKWVFLKENLQISLRKSKFESVDIRRVEQILNEGYCDLPSAGFFGTGSGHPYCEYKLLPLNNKSLEQKDHKKKNLGNIIQVGNFVVGKSIDDGQEYKGIIQKFNRDRWNDIQSVVILGKSNARMIRLEPSSVRLTYQYPKSDKRFDSGKHMMNSLGACIGGILTR